MRVADLRPSDRNPWTISTGRLDSLKRSLQQDREFLEARPLLVNSYPGRENVVIAGNMRLRAAQELGWAEVPVLMVSAPPDVEAQWNLKDNNQWGDYLEADLARILDELTARGADTELLGFEPAPKKIPRTIVQNQLTSNRPIRGWAELEPLIG